jgi:hypothetical protein
MLKISVIPPSWIRSGQNFTCRNPISEKYTVGIDESAANSQYLTTRNWPKESANSQYLTGRDPLIHRGGGADNKWNDPVLMNALSSLLGYQYSYRKLQLQKTTWPKNT